MSRKSPFGFLFGKNLENLISGIRRRPDPEEQNTYIGEVIAECRDEVRSADYDIKTMAVLKLAYLEMRGYDMTWAGFHVIEVMASPSFQQKRIGYIAAMQSFRGDSELLMLVTNLLKMDLVNKNVATVGIALSGLASIVTPLLAQDVSDDIMRMLAHSNARIRQKAVLALHKVVLQYPEIFPVAITRISDLIDTAQKNHDDVAEVSVLCAAVSVVGELAYHMESLDTLIELTPRLYDIFITTKNNWTTLKLVKIFQLFCTHEPKLHQRIFPALHDALQNATAVSVKLELMHCIVFSKMLHDDDYELAKDLLTQCIDLVDDSSANQGWASADANIKYVVIGLLVKMAEINALFVPSELVASILKVPQTDPATLKRVFSLAIAAVNDTNLVSIVENLVMQCNRSSLPSTKRDIVNTVAAIGAVRNYEHVLDFKWYIGILSEFAAHVYADCLSQRLLDIAIRVHDAEVQEAVANACFNWLNAESGASEGPGKSSSGPREFIASTREEFEKMASTFWWIIGEFPTQLMLDNFSTVLEIASRFSASPELVTCISKLASKQVARTQYVDVDSVASVLDFLEPLTYSIDFEVQERACECNEVFKLALNTPEKAVDILGSELKDLYSSYILQPVAPGSQRRIHPPADLDLDTEIVKIDLESIDEEEESIETDLFSQPTDILFKEPPPQLVETDETLAKRELFDLSNKTPDLTSSLFSVPDQEKPKLVKKKLHVAVDETVEDEPFVPTKPANNHIFNVQFKTPVVRADEPVKVKHKKRKKKHSKKETEPKADGDTKSVSSNLSQPEESNDTKLID